MSAVVSAAGLAMFVHDVWHVWMRTIGRKDCRGMWRGTSWRRVLCIKVNGCKLISSGIVVSNFFELGSFVGQNICVFGRELILPTDAKRSASDMAALA